MVKKISIYGEISTIELLLSGNILKATLDMLQRPNQLLVQDS